MWSTKRAHFFDPPAGPGPNLRRAVIQDRDAVGFGAAGDPPVEAGVVDEHDGVGAMVAEVAIGAAGEIEKLVNVQQDTKNPHDGQGGEVGMQVAAGGGHFGTTVADTFDVGLQAAELAMRLAPCRSPLGSPAEKKIFMRV